MAASSDSEPHRLGRAEELYLAHVRSLGEHDTPDLDRLAKEHPSVAEDLRRIDEEFRWLDEACDAEVQAREALPPDITRMVEFADRDRYTVLDEIARGGMGTIYRVRDERLMRTLAMKVAHASAGASSRSTYRFLEEAQIMGRLDHPGVLPVHDIGVDAEDRLFFTMHLVRGHSLRRAFQMVHDGSSEWTLARAILAVIKVCETVEFAHRRNLIHRDLKPSNVMVGRLGEVYVMDWGLARVLGEVDPHGLSLDSLDPGEDAPIALRQRKAQTKGDDNLLTMDGSVVGTPSFMAPEQARGERDNVGPRADVYAIGGMLYQLLTGSAPFGDRSSDDDALAVLHGVRSGPPTPVEELAPDAPSELVAIANKAMAREESDRYASAEGLAEDLRAWIEQRPVSAYRTGLGVELRKWTDRNRLTAFALAAVVVAVVTGALAIFAIQRTNENDLREVNSELVDANDALTLTGKNLSIERDRADRSAYAANIAAAQAVLNTGRVDIARAHLDRCPIDMRGWEWQHLASLLDGSLQSFETQDQLISAVTFLPDGQNLALVHSDGVIRIRNLSMDVPERTIGRQRTGTFLNSIARSVDGQLLFTGSEVGSVSAWDATSTSASVDSQPLWRSPRITREVYDLLVLADGRLLVASRQGLFAFALEDGELLAERSFGYSVHAVDIDPNGERLILSIADGTFRLIDSDTFEPLETLPFGSGLPAAHERPVRFHPAGKQIAFAASDGRVFLADLPQPGTTLGMHAVQVLGQHASRIHHLEFSPDGRFLTSASWDHTLRVFDVEAGEPLRIARGHASRVHGLAWHPTQSLFASGGKDALKLWEPFEHVDNDRQAFPSRMSRFVIHPIDARILLGGPNPGVSIWDPESGDCLWRACESGENVEAVAFEPGTTRIAAGDAAGWIRIWETSTSTIEHKFRVGKSKLFSLEFHPNRPLIVVANLDGEMKVFDTRTWETTASTTHDGWLTAFDITPDGLGVLATGASGMIALYDIETLTVQRELAVSEARLNQIMFDPTGTRIATAGRDNLVHLLDASTWERIGVLRGHVDHIRDVAFTPDGKQLASGSRDHTVRFWDLANLEQTAVFPDQPLWVNDVEFHPDGDWMIAASQGMGFYDSKPARRRIGARTDATTRIAQRVESAFEGSANHASVLAEINTWTDLSADEMRAARHVAQLRPTPASDQNSKEAPNEEGAK